MELEGVAAVGAGYPPHQTPPGASPCAQLSFFAREAVIPSHLVLERPRAHLPPRLSSGWETAATR
eukprot:scaffold151508_cov29-Tisochrysis_lutea.AAC.2